MPTDFVVEQSENIDPASGWVWRKWASGIAEAWYSHKTVFKADQAWANGWAMSEEMNNLTYPFVFAAVPEMTRTAKGASASAFFVMEQSAQTVAQTGSMRMSQNGAPSASSYTAYLHHSVKGRWK